MTTWPSDGLAAGAWGAGGGGPANPQDLNRYSYAANNPTTFNDPSGHIVFVPALILGAKAIGKGVAWLGARYALRAAAARAAATPAWRRMANPDAWRMSSNSWRMPPPSAARSTPNLTEIAKGVEFNVWLSAAVGGGSKLMTGKPEEAIISIVNFNLGVTS